MCTKKNHSMLTLKSKISANMYGPPCVNVRFGFMISDKITESSPYLPRNSFAHSIPSCPKPPARFCEDKILVSFYMTNSLASSAWNHTKSSFYSSSMWTRILASYENFRFICVLNVSWIVAKLHWWQNWTTHWSLTFI